MDAIDELAFIVVGSEGKTLPRSELIGPRHTRQSELLLSATINRLRLVDNGEGGAMLLTEPDARSAGWDFSGCDTQFGVHGLHTYVAAMIPQLAERLIDLFAPVDGIVLDPFCGGGAVLVETIRSGRAAIGRDVNDLAVLISKGKTTHVPERETILSLERVLQSVDHSISAPAIDEGLAFWFKPEHVSRIESLRQAIDDAIELEDPVRSYFLTAFSATVRDVSLTYRNEIRLRRMSPDEIAKFNVDPIERFQSRILRSMMSIAELPNEAETDIEQGMAQRMRLEAGSVDAIVCSPPYGDERNGVSYSQFAKNMLAWLGYSTAEIRGSKGLTLGWGSHGRDAPKSDTLDQALDRIAGFAGSVREAVAFYADYQVALTEMARVCRGPIVIVVGNRVLRDTIFHNGEITVDFMDNIGLRLTDRFCRRLPSKRLPRMRRFGAAIENEDILVFQQ